MSSDFPSLKEEYHHLYEYVSTLAWMQYEQMKKKGKEYTGYVYFFGRTVHRLLHPLYFFHQTEEPKFWFEEQTFDPNNPAETFPTWEAKKAYLLARFREKKFEIYDANFSRKVLSRYNHQIIQWLVKNNYHRLIEFDKCLGFYLDILNWTEEHFISFYENRLVNLLVTDYSPKTLSTTESWCKVV